MPDGYMCHGDSGFGDYIIQNIDENGQIENYTRPEVDIEQWSVVNADD